jgi:apolipoprotein D and lipocalin family protein
MIEGMSALTLARIRIGVLCSTLLLWGCQTMKPIRTVESVDLKRFMGDWYVIACIPTFIETDAFNAVESYKLAEDGTIKTTFFLRPLGTKTT